MFEFIKKIGKENFPYIPKFVYLLVAVLVVLIGVSIYTDQQFNNIGVENQNQEIPSDTITNNSAALYIISPTETTMTGFPAEISGATIDPNIKNVLLYINEQDVLASSRIQTEVVGADWVFNQTNGLQTGFKIGENHLRFVPLYEGESVDSFDQQRAAQFSLELVITVVDLPIENKSQEIIVKWLEQPIKTDFYDFFGNNYNNPDTQVNERVQKRMTLYEGILPKNNNDMGGMDVSSVSAYKTGEVQGGEYDGYNTYVFSSGQCQDSEGMGCILAVYRVLKDPITTEILLLEKYSTKIAVVETGLFDKVLTETTIAGFQIPSDFSLKGYHLRKTDYWYSNSESWFFDQELEPVATHPDYGIVYTPSINAGQLRPNNSLYIKLPDDRVVTYTFDVPFMPSGETMPNITWKDGTKNKADYYYQDRGGCGASNEFAVRSDKEVQPDTRLVLDGNANNGDKIYILRDKQDAEYKTMYDSYQPYLQDGETRISFDEYVARRPLFYWQDNFGRWIKFSRMDNLLQAECGKPVIYLYPEKEMAVKVRVDLHGPMTKSEPWHGKQGWSVVAKSDGYVVNKVDGKTYPNFFWEGYGVNYEIPKQGFVVKKEEAPAWLEKTLKEIGFTERENKEFREFWVPRLPNAPYVFITFVDQKYFDRDAALQIVPKPDHVYRIFMETRGLSGPTVVAPLSLPKIIRDGFTVVEWGGALRN